MRAKKTAKRRAPPGRPKAAARRHPVPKPGRTPRLPADPRPKALAKQGGAVTGHVFHDPETGEVMLMTSDHRKEIAKLAIVRRYQSPRHEQGTEMVMYRAVIDGVDFVGRSSGLVLVLRPFWGGGFH